MKLILSLCCCLLLTCTVFAQKPLRSNVAYIAGALSSGSRFESQFVGFAGSPSPQYRLYEQLRRTCTPDELLTLTSHKSPVVRVYAFKALAGKNHRLAAKRYPVLAADTASLFTLNGCLGSTATVSELVTGIFSPLKHSPAKARQ